MKSALVNFCKPLPKNILAEAGPIGYKKLLRVEKCLKNLKGVIEKSNKVFVTNCDGEGRGLNVLKTTPLPHKIQKFRSQFFTRKFLWRHDQKFYLHFSVWKLEIRSQLVFKSESKIFRNFSNITGIFFYC